MKFDTILNHTRPARTKVVEFSRKRPFATLFALLGILLVLIIISNLLNRPKAEPEAVKPPPKKVAVYQIGSAPKITVQAQIEKSGVVTISALSPGVVQDINVNPGDSVSRGQTLISMSTTYQGGNLPVLQANLAAAQLKNINETYDSQKSLINTQIDLAKKADENADQLRDITVKSLDETRSLISLNDDILSTIDANINAGTNVEVNKQLKTQFLSANSQLKAGLRNAEYAAPSDKPPAQLSDLQKDITLKQLDIQAKALDLNREVARLQYQIALVGQQAMFPSAPFNATVQRVNVKVGDAVNPGTPLLVLSQAIEDDPIVAIAYVPREIASKVSYFEPSILSIGNFTVEAYPSYVTQDAIKGSLYGVYFSIPDNYHQYLTNNGYMNIQMPVGAANTGSAVPFIPIDSVYQTEDSSYVFVIKNKAAATRELKLGAVTGRYVEVEQGLMNGDTIILDRTVVSGDPVTTK